MDLFKINTNLKKRIMTSFALFILLFLILVDNFILTYILIVASVIALLEFFNINSILNKKNKMKQVFLNFIFALYILIFSTFFLIFSLHFHLKLLLFIILITCVASDIGGFVFGKIFKGPKLTKISPNKTIFGSVGSFIFSITTVLCITYYLTKILDPYLIIVGLLTSFGCQIGDLFFSYLKRKTFLKDTGNFLPGHGGILDRIDGLLLGIPAGYLILLILY